MGEKMSEQIQLTKFFLIDRETLFNYFVRADLLEKWAAPEGMTLRIPQFEAKIGGRYRYEHTGQDGVYICTGHFREFDPGRKLVQWDELISKPNGEPLYKSLESSIEFNSKLGGTEVKINQRGLPDEKSAKECEMGWSQSFDKLDELIRVETGLSSSKKEELRRMGDQSTLL